MVRLTVTEAMLEALASCKEQSSAQVASTQDPDFPDDDVKLGSAFTHDQVLSLWKRLRASASTAGQGSSKNPSAVTLDELLHGTQVYVEPPKPKPEPSPEYRALMDRLRQDEEARQYARLVESAARETDPSSSAQGVAGPSWHNSRDEVDEVTYEDVNRQITLIFNVIVSIVACSIALWWVSGHWSAPRRLALSMSGSIVVGVAEVVVYAGYIRRVKEAKAEAKKKPEVKQLVDTWVIEPAAGLSPVKETKTTLEDPGKAREPDQVRRRRPTKR